MVSAVTEVAFTMKVAVGPSADIQVLGNDFPHSGLS